MLNLKETYWKRYRIGLDISYEAEQYEGKSQDIHWYYELLGKYGQIYPHSTTHLQLWITPKLGKRLYDNLPPDWTVVQNTSEGYSFAFPEKDISIAFKWIRPRKRHLGTTDPARIAKLKAVGARYLFQKKGGDTP